MNARNLAWTAAALGVLVHGHRELMAGLRRRAAPPVKRFEPPAVTVIRPIRGLDVDARENVRALLGLDYPGEWEVLFVFDSEDDPAFLPTREEVAARPTRAKRVELIVAGEPPAGMTGKLNAMQVGVARSRCELLAFSDSDTRPSPGVLTALVGALLEDGGTGATFAPIYAAADAPLAGDVGYGLLVNAWYGASVACTAAPDGALPFLMGQLMVFRRQALESIGGVGCAAGQFVDDMYLGRRLHEAGWKNRVVHAPLRVVTGHLGLGAFLRIFRRWLLFSESGIPGTFARPLWVRGAVSWLSWGALATAVARRAWSPALLSAVPIGFSVWSQLRLQRACHGPEVAPRHYWVPALLPLLGAGVALSARLSRDVDWRGRGYRLDAKARLGEAQPARASV
ncbi:glycosyltransferase [Corallococcus sp. AB004]|uniref:glycosyltransferase n=1 Tax=Corallococcus TaxID=83461 RepID=UPI000EA08670|nr:MULTISPECIES: glycosyltransferase [Corallococcus]RKI35547.1 glycosyltransferase [Corallococcus sp. AB004]NPC69017.1 glycosyltransferase [Corallococcus exiguus]NPD22590.1 glycosyltransferase [Corallococcus exiguus]NRD42972.1 glycosyltransferase [Corallococcus exiguus]RKI04938.1 glycosyltransferase [Corallococcus sp. AB038B]